MAAMIALQKIERVPAGLARKANIAAVLATAYSLYALYTTGEQAMLYGGLVTFAGWMLYGFVSPRFLTADTPAAVAPEVPTAPVLAPVPPVAVLAPTNGDVVRA
jgi:putrescine:ornithine antiporter